MRWLVILQVSTEQPFLGLRCGSYDRWVCVGFFFNTVWDSGRAFANLVVGGWWLFEDKERDVWKQGMGQRRVVVKVHSAMRFLFVR